MADIEIPDPKEAQEKSEDPISKGIALWVAVFAVILAICSLGGSNAAKEMMMAQMEASNEWAYYQAKVVRENLYNLRVDELTWELQTKRGGLSQADLATLEKLLAAAEKKAKDYKDEKEAIKKKAEEFEEKRNQASRKDPYFDFAEVALQIAIVMASVAMLSGHRWPFFVSVGLPAIGSLLTINGYLLLLKIPGFE